MNESCTPAPTVHGAHWAWLSAEVYADVRARSSPTKASTGELALRLSLVPIGAPKLDRMKVESVVPLLAATLAAFPAVAAESAEATSAGAGAVAARVDWASRSLEHRACAAAPCNAAGGARIKLELPGVTDAAVRIDNVPLGEGRAVLHVVVKDKKSEATWEALVAPSSPGVGGAGSQLLFAGATGFTAGESGERRGEAVVSLARARGEGRYLVVGNVSESATLCGEPRTLVAPRALDPQTMTLRSASVQQLSPERRAAAVKLVARAKKEPPAPPLGKLLVAQGTTDPRTAIAMMVDGDLGTRWSEVRSGSGAGEAVMLRTPSRVPVKRLAVVTVPAAAVAADDKKPKSSEPSPAVAPKSFYLATEKKLYLVELPEDAAQTKNTFEIILPEAHQGACLAVVLDEAYARGLAKPEVSIAELVAYSELDVPGASLGDLARSLKTGGADAQLAAEILKRAGGPAVDALADEMPALDEAGRLLALDVAMAAGGCDRGARALVRALVDSSAEVAKRAEKGLLRCGSAATAPLLVSLDQEDAATRAKVAAVLSLVAPSRALRPIALKLGQGAARDRALLRASLARAAKRADARELVALFDEVPREARSELLRALSGRLGEARERASLAALEWLEKDGSFPARYLAAEPLGELARAGDMAATSRFVAMLGGDADWPVRARVAALAGPVPAAHGKLLRALSDKEPRVREAALRAVEERGVSAAAVRVGALLAQDPWTFVRSAAAAALGAMPAAPDIDRTLVASLADASHRVRGDALEALGRHRALSFAEPVRERAEDDHEHLDVRSRAIGALGRMCDASSLDLFTKLARRLTLPYPERVDLDLGIASVRALGAVHPADLERRLAPLLSKESKASVRDAATAAIAEPSQCR